eukprot:scaffold12.g8151.t1
MGVPAKEPRKEEADAGSNEYAGDALAAQGVRAENVVASAHEQAMAEADQASAVLREHEVPHSPTGMGQPTGELAKASASERAGVAEEEAPAVDLHLPSAEDWQQALYPRAVEPAPDHIVTTGVDERSFFAPTEWPRAQLRGRAAPEEGDKAKQAAKQRVVEDKTFGLKNKGKSAKVQKYVEQLQKSVQPQRNPRLEEPTRKDKKKAEEERQKELNDLFALAIKQPKARTCPRAWTPNLSHDLSVERKKQQIDLFQDQRDGGDKEEGMADWDQETLEKAIAQKHGAENKNRPTEIICKFFLEAVERKLYGWFWQCPNGKDCKYRHALPPGYVLKSQMKELLEAEAANQPSVEEVIEEERAKVDAKTPITDESFAKWKAAKMEAKLAARHMEEEERRRKGILTGREIFEEEGFVAEDDASAAAAYERDVDDEAEAWRAEQQARGCSACCLSSSNDAGGAGGGRARGGGAAEALQQARAATPAAEAPAPGGGDGAGPSSSTGAGGGGGGGGGGVATTLQLSEQEAAELFEGSDEEDDDELLDDLERELEEKATVG